MPELFPSLFQYLAAVLVVAGAQLIYATVGFGSGMIAVGLLSLVLSDLEGAIVALALLSFITEVWVALHAGRATRVTLVLGLLPTTCVGLWLGTYLLGTLELIWLKRALGGVVLGTGAWFLLGGRRVVDDGARELRGSVPATRHANAWWSLPVGLASGTLGGLFGAGGPPVIVFLHVYRLTKAEFRATIIWFFLVMSIVRGGLYLHAGLLTWSSVQAAAWLLPATVVGIALGMALHRRLSERAFAHAIAVVLVLLGVLLVWQNR